MLDDLVRSAPVGLALLDEEHRFLYVNQALADLDGVAVEDHIGRKISDVVTNPGPEVEAACDAVIRGEASLKQLDVETEHPGQPGEKRVWQVTCYPLEPEEGKKAIAAVVEDVTEQRQVEESLDKAVAARNEFVSFVSHEIRGPLTIIQGYASLLAKQKELRESGQWRVAVDEIYRETVRLNDIIANLLAMARLEHGASVTIDPIILRHALGRVLDDYRQTSGRRIEESFPEQVAVVRGNDVFMGQVLRNLLSNAEKYSPADKPIEVTARDEGDHVVVSVRDYGIGLDEEEKQRVFEPFYRSTTKDTRPGVGIGLTVSKRIVEAMGGTMWVESEKGEGSTFCFTLKKYDTGAPLRR